MFSAMAAAAGAGVAAATQENMQSVLDRVVLMDVTFLEVKKEIEEATARTESYRIQTTQTLSQRIDKLNKDNESVEDDIGKRFASHEIMINNIVSEAKKEFGEARTAVEIIKTEVSDLFHKCDAMFTTQKGALEKTHNDAQVAFAQTRFELDTSKTDHQEPYKKTETTFQEYERKLNTIEGVNLIDKFSIVEKSANEVQK